MQTRTPTTCKGDKGFTLVELAIVMIIIGLLIGGVLKGQELITNAQVTSTVGQIKGYDAAVTTFRDAQNGLPGDLLTPTTRLPNCANAPCNRAGDGDGIIGGTTVGVAQTVATEGGAAWAQLNASNLISGIQQDAAAQGFGILTPSSSIGGGYFLGYTNDGTAQVLTGPAIPVGHYLAIAGVAGANVTAANGILTTAKGARVDRKLDDGAPNAGLLRAAGNAACASTATAAGVWAENDTTSRCAVYAKIQN